VKFFRFGYETEVSLIYQNGTKNLSVAMVIAITSFKSQAIFDELASVLAQFPVSGLFDSLIVRLMEYLMNHDMRAKGNVAGKNAFLKR
jgi:hypothetical protein